jgi:hypothetical protein
MARHSTHLDAIKINDKLKTVIRKLEEGRCEYIDDNISDATVGKELDVLPSSVARIRLQLYGALVAARGNMLIQLSDACKDITLLQARCDAMAKEIDQRQHQIAEAARQHNDLRERFHKLCMHLSINRVSDVRHLSDQAIVNGQLQSAANTQQRLPYQR